MMEFMHDDLPDPVAPEMRMCGISARLAMTARPAMSRPMATSRGWPLALRASLRLEDVAQRDELARPVRHLDADGRLARDGCEDAHVGRRHGVGDVLGEAGDAGDLDARARARSRSASRSGRPCSPTRRVSTPCAASAPHQLLAGGVDLALVLAHLLRLVQQAHLGQCPLPGAPRRGGDGRHRQVRLGLERRLGLRLGVERDVDVGVVLVGGRLVRRVAGLGVEVVADPARPRPDRSSSLRAR